MQCGTFSCRHNTVTADVLARLIRGKTLTSMSAVFSASTTRLAPKIFVLRRKYGWGILSPTATIYTVDGRITEIGEYSLSAASIDAAMAGGGARYCESVRVARDRLRRALQ